MKKLTPLKILAFGLLLAAGPALTAARLQTAVSSLDVFRVISVQRFDEWMTPT